MARSAEGGGEKYTVRSVLNDPASPRETGPAGERKAALPPRDRAKNIALNYLKRPHSEQEVRAKLREKGCAEGDIDAVCAQCVDYGFINDREYAGMIVRRYSGAGYGPGRIRGEFTRRGIPRELWDEALADLPEGTENIDRALAAKLRGRDISDRREREKAAAALFRKGYSWEDIRAALARYGQPDEYD